MGHERRAVEEAGLGIPDSIRPVIERQIARLSPIERRVLEAASVVGDTFDLAVVAEAAELDEDGAETTLGQPGSRRFVRSSAATPADDRRSPQLEFVHALFRDTLYGGIPRSRRAALHRRIAAVEERIWGARAGDIAAELALHSSSAARTAGPSTTFSEPATSARRRSAFREARRHYEHALELLMRAARR